MAGVNTRNAPTSQFHPAHALRQGHLSQGAKGREFVIKRQTNAALAPVNQSQINAGA
jgi:hypothetical protein